MKKNNVIASETTNLLTGRTVTITSNHDIVTIEESQSLQAIPQKSTFELQTIPDFVPSERSGSWGPWEYTGLAIGKYVFAALVDIPFGAVLSSIAAIFNITQSAASLLVGYMGAWGLMGGALADALDTNHNGWIGLYKRQYLYPPFSYGHRTY